MSVFDEFYDKKTGELTMPMYGIYRALLRKLKETPRSDKENFSKLVTALFDIISYFNVQTLQEECTDELTMYLKSV